MDGFAGLMAGVARACSWAGDLVVLSLSTPLDDGQPSGATVAEADLEWHPFTGLPMANELFDVAGNPAGFVPTLHVAALDD